MSKQNSERLLHYLNPEIPVEIRHFGTLPSTNITARTLAAEGAPAWTVVLADSQTAGRGRLNRHFFSPAGTGLYMSIILRSSLPAIQALRITPAAAVSTAEAIEAISGRSAQIKWVNDILLDGKKVCGILTESIVAPESGTFSYAVLGIGINILPPPDGFPPEISGIAASIAETASDPDELRMRLAAEVLNRFFRIYETLDTAAFFADYKRRLCCLNRPVLLQEKGTERVVIPVDLDPSFRLIVRPSETASETASKAALETISSGEIRLKII